MREPMMIPRVPKTRRATARAISLIGGLLFAVYDVSIIMSSSEIENAWSTYIFRTLSDFFCFCFFVSPNSDCRFSWSFWWARVSYACVDWFMLSFALISDFVFKFHFLESVRYWIYFYSPSIINLIQDFNKGLHY